MSKTKEYVIILDFGGQYTQLIARRVRESNVYCEILPYYTSYERIKALNPKGIILSGGPSSVNLDNAPRCDEQIFDGDIPVLGICYGVQLMAKHFEGEVAKGTKREYGKTELFVDEDSGLLAGVKKETSCWMSHTDLITKLPENFRILAHTEHTPVAALQDNKGRLFGVQFHPEVVHTPEGMTIIKNFLYGICGCHGTWDMGSYITETIEKIKSEVGDKKVLCALSGGVDSSVAAVLVHRAIGNNLTCIFVDHGLLRKGEAQGVIDTFQRGFGMKLIAVDARERFLGRLKGVTDPERKRKIIGEEFIRVFEEEAVKLGEMDYLVQGTIYPDVVESGTGTAETIKSHHNVGGLPEDMALSLIEPLRYLFKDEVRRVGEELGIPKEVVWRQPFPGPGLAIRIIGDVTEERLEILKEADYIIREEIKNAGLDKEIWQYFAVLPAIQSVGVMGDSRTYDYPIILRAVTSEDGMTADWARIPYDLLEKISNRVVNEVKGVNRMVYDITSKPPGTIEWE